MATRGKKGNQNKEYKLVIDNWRIISFILLGFICYILSFVIDNLDHSSCYILKIFSGILSGVGLSFVGGAIITWSIDFPKTLKRYKQSIIEAITTNKYLSEINSARLLELRNDVTAALYTNSKKMEEGLIELDKNICVLLNQPYYSWYRQNIKCEENTPNVKYLIKHVEIEYEMINPDESSFPIEDIGLILYTEPVNGIENDELVHIISLSYRVDHMKENKSFDDLHNEVIESSKINRDNNYSYCIKTSYTERKLPLQVSFHKSLYVKFLYDICIPRADVLFSKRLRHPTKSFIINYSIDNKEKILHGELIGSLIAHNDCTISGNDSNNLSIESRKWLLPKNGAVILITPKIKE